VQPWEKRTSNNLSPGRGDVRPPGGRESAAAPWRRPSGAR